VATFLSDRLLSETPVLILAGGTGVRLFPLTVSRPKPLLPLGLFRVIDFTLLNCRNSGLSKETVLTQYCHEHVAEYIRKSWQREIHCVPPANGMTYRGTADAVFQNLTLLRERAPRHVLILCADQLYSMDYRKILQRHVETNADVTVSVTRLPLNQARSFGVVEVDRSSRVTGFQEKPPAPHPLPQQPDSALVSMGVYVFKMQTLVESLHATCGKGKYDFGRDVLPWLLHSAGVYSYDFRDEVLDTPNYWRDIGSIDAYFEASMDLARPHPPTDLRAFGLPGRAAAPPPGVGVSREARVRRTMVCRGVHIEDDAEVEDCILMPGVHVGRGAKLRRAIVDQGVEVMPGLTVGWNTDSDHEHFVVSPGGVSVVVSSAVSRLRGRSGSLSKGAGMGSKELRVERSF
jgi:glucose-1-phosphate adenylyltransferase